jgi:hypothetical protein
MPITQAHERYLEVLFDKVNQDKYPSGELLDRIETVLDREHVDEYLALLFQKVEECRYPSKQMLDRIVRFVLSGS